MKWGKWECWNIKLERGPAEGGPPHIYMIYRIWLVMPNLFIMLLAMNSTASTILFSF